MRIKSYFSGTVEAAMELARRELGDDAVILNSRAAPAEARHLGAYEVVFGVDDAAAAPAAQERAEPPAAPAGRGHRFELLEGEIVALRQELRKVSRGILAPESHWKGGGTPIESAPAQARRENADLVEYLMRRDLPAGPAGELVRRGRERLDRTSRGARLAAVPAADWRRETGAERGLGLFAAGSGVFPAHPGVLAGVFADESPLASAVLDQLAAVLRVDATLGRLPGGATTVVALVGGAGAGKTTTLVKLAAQYGLRMRRPTHIISTDNLRVGAAEQLRAYAAILGVGFDLAETAVALGQLLNEHTSKDLILIDTPGLSPGQMEDGSAIARFLGSDPRVDCHLVVPAYQKGSDVTRLMERFYPYGASKVILTRLDETEAIGGLLLALDESEARVSYLTMGQTIPEDLEPATVARLLDLFVGDPPMGAFMKSDTLALDAPLPRQERRVVAGSRT